MESKKIEVLPSEVVVDIKISGSFYKRMQELFIYYSNLKDKETFMAAYSKVIGNQITDDYEYHLYTLLALIHEVEIEAKKNNFTKFVDESEITSSDS